MFELRPYQTEAENQARIALARGVKRVALYLPTGGGKTLTATSIIQKATAKGRKVVFLANRKQLVRQTSEVLTRYGIDHGILQADNTRSIGARVLVASIDTVHVRGLPDDVGLLIIDECHGVAGSEKYKKLLATYNNVPVIGLTATPFAAGMGKHYGELQGCLFQELVVSATIKDLIADGYLVDCDIYAPSEPDLKGVKSAKGIDGVLDYNQTELVVSQRRTDRCLAYLVRLLRRPLPSEDKDARHKIPSESVKSRDRATGRHAAQGKERCTRANASANFAEGSVWLQGCRNHERAGSICRHGRQDPAKMC